MICVYCGKTDLQNLNDYNRVSHLNACQKRLKEKEEREFYKIYQNRLH